MGTMEQAAPTAVVTGATGFVASELVKQLLEKGYTVRGTVRSLHNESKVQHLQRLGKALPGKLTLHEADLLKVCLWVDCAIDRNLPPSCIHRACCVCRRALSTPSLKEPHTSFTQRESGSA